jgi:hypothetical protein
MVFIVTLTLCAAVATGATAPCPASLAHHATLQEPEEVGGPPSAPFEAPPLCPEPLVCEPRWTPLELTAEGRVVFTHPTLEPLAEVLAEDFAAVTGLKLAVAGIPARSGDIVLSLGYMPDLVRENPEAFFIEVFDHVLIAGQTLEGTARATARFLQLVRPPEAATGEAEVADPNTRAATTAGVGVPPLRIVDAPSIRWRVLEMNASQLMREEREATGAGQRCAALAHLAGFNALCIVEQQLISMTPEQRATLTKLYDEAARRSLVLVEEDPLPGGPRLRRVDRYDITPEVSLTERAAMLEKNDTIEFLRSDPFLFGIPPDALGADAEVTRARLHRLLHPIRPIGRSPEAPPLLGTLFGHATGLERTAFLPVGWWSALGAPDGVMPLAGEAWHGGMRVDSLRGAPELERVLAAVNAALRRAK